MPNKIAQNTINVKTKRAKMHCGRRRLLALGGKQASTIIFFGLLLPLCNVQKPEPKINNKDKTVSNIPDLSSLLTLIIFSFPLW